MHIKACESRHRQDAPLADEDLMFSGDNSESVIPLHRP
jgi:hypothetical protein